MTDEMTDQEVLELLRSDSPLNKARRWGAIEQAGISASRSTRSRCAAWNSLPPRKLRPRWSRARHRRTQPE
jgi:hypothetical protein